MRAPSYFYAIPKSYPCPYKHKCAIEHGCRSEGMCGWEITSDLRFCSHFIRYEEEHRMENLEEFDIESLDVNDGYVSFDAFVRGRLGITGKYGAIHLLGNDEWDGLSDGLRVRGDEDNYYDIMIHISDAEKFAERYEKRKSSAIYKEEE